MRAPEVVLLLLLCYFLVFSYVFYLLQYSTTSGAHSWLCYRPWVIHPRLLKCSPSGYKFALTALCFGEEAPPNLPVGRLKVICFVDSFRKHYVSI